MNEKTPAKIDIKVGSISFSAEGEQSWLGEQLAKVLEAAQLSGAIQGEAIEQPASETSQTKGKFVTSLGAYLKAKDAGSNQTKRFLATAAWLERRGVSQLATASVTGALSSN